VIRLRSDGLFWRELRGEVVALDADASLYFSANSSAAALWKRLEGGTTEADLVEALCERYAVERDVAEAAVADFVKQLEARGLLERDDAA
jgi:hypothetical protein